MFAEIGPLYGPGTAESGFTTSPQGPADSTYGNGTAATLTITSVSGTTFSFSYNGGAVSTIKFAYNSSASAIQTALNSTAGVSGATVTASQTANTFLLTFPAASSITPSLLTTTVAGTLTTGALMSLADVGAGVWDAMWAKTFAVLAAQDPYAVLQFGNEMYGDWYPYGGPSNTAAMTAAYKDLVTLARQSSATFTFDWGGGAKWKGYDPMTATGGYPGDSYVDYISSDYYDGLAWNDSPSSGHLSGAASWNYAVTNYLTEGLAFAQTHGKPYCLSEWGLGLNVYDPSGGVPVDDPAFIETAYYWMRANAGELGYCTYFEADVNSWPGGLRYSPQSTAVFSNLFGAWAQELAGSTAYRFLTTGTDRYRVK
jgi:hypothetical protein